MNIREKFEELVRSTKLKLSRDNKEYNKIYDSNDINKNVLSKYSKEELISNKDKLREFLVSQDMIDNLSQEELKELISHLDYEDIKDIVFFSKLKMSNDKTTSFLSFLNEEDLAKYILERGEASLSIFNNNYELLKPLIDDGTIFDIFNYDVVSVILNTMLYMNDYEYIIGLLGNSKIITNFSSSFVENLATSYFINYDVFKDINIDKTLPLALSGKQLASFYSTWYHKDDYYKEWQSQQEKEKEEMGESDAYNVKYFLESQKIEKEMLGRFIERFGLNFNKSLFLNHVEIFSMSPEEDKIETLTKLFPAFMEQYNGKSFNEIFNIELKKCKDIYSIGDIVENYDEYLVRDLEELPLDKEILDYLTMSFLQEKGGDIVKRFFYSQLIKYAEEKYNISVKKSIYNGKGAKTLEPVNW